MRLRAYRTLILVLVGAVALAAVSVLVGSRMESPAQVAANARPPTPSVPKVRVRSGILKATVAFRAEVSESSPVAIRTPTSIGSADPVVTAMLLKRGALASEGDLVMSVAERPVFVLRG